MGRTESNIMWLTPRVLEVDEPYQQYRQRMVKSGNPKNTGKTKPSNLTMQVKMNKNWPTPCVAIARNGCPHHSQRLERKRQQGWTIELHDMATSGMMGNWMTPDCSDRRSKNSKQQGLSNQVNNGKLNPSWVESLMGVPTNHTQLSTATDQNDNRIDRLRLLGNGVVPQTAAKAFRTLLSRLEQD
jgi:site-specific DNA-cytosine methylase